MAVSQGVSTELSVMPEGGGGVLIRKLDSLQSTQYRDTCVYALCLEFAFPELVMLMVCLLFCGGAKLFVQLKYG